jgi:sialic acid synthase SpsE
MLDTVATPRGRAPVTVIADFASNHLGDPDLARRLVAEAAAVGADMACLDADLQSDGVPPSRQSGSAWLDRFSLDATAHRELYRASREHGIDLMGSPQTLNHARFLIEDLCLPAVKVRSAEMLNLELLDYLDSQRATVYLETGLAELAEVRMAVSRLERTPELVIMHCVDLFPVADGGVLLQAIGTLATSFPDRRVGYADHTIGFLAPLLAVALGSTAITKHFTLDRSLPGADHILSVTPTELSELISRVRQAELMLGSGAPSAPDHLTLVSDRPRAG